MGSYSTRKFESSLISKGFKEDKTHHKFFWFYCENKKSSVFTKTSHGEKEFGDNLLKQRKDQMKFETKRQFVSFYTCPMAEKEYRDYLINRGYLEV